MNQVIQFNPNRYARIGGALYLLLIFVGMFSVLFVRDKLIIPGDPAATARNIIGSESLWRSGIIADLVMHLLDIPIMLVLYVLLKPVNKNIALLALLFNLVQTAVLVANKLNLVAALLPLGNAEYLHALDPRILQTQLYLSIKLHDIGFGIGLLFFGCTCIANGWLIRKSNYLPGTIGILMQVAGVCYLASNLLLLSNPTLASKIFIFLMLPCLIAELSFSLWLLIKGVNIKKWEARIA
ncbi:MAG: DUF4386 domain-containing protein [Bacteroidota bacterium]